MRILASRTTTFVSRLSAVLLAVAAASAVGTTTANASSGGGCATGAHLESCISASGSHLEPDIYVLHDSGCSYVSVEVLNASNGAIAWQDDQVNGGCALGIHGPWALDTANSSVANGGTYYTVATMTLTNGTSDMTISHNETLSY